MDAWLVVRLRQGLPHALLKLARLLGAPVGVLQALKLPPERRIAPSGVALGGWAARWMLAMVEASCVGGGERGGGGAG